MLAAHRIPSLTLLAALALSSAPAAAQAPLEPVEVEGQPLAANLERLSRALEFLGAPLPAELRRDLEAAGRARDARRLQELIDPGVLIAVSINPETRVKASRGPAPARLQQAGYTPVLLKVLNSSGATAALRVSSPQAGPAYAGVARLSLERQKQTQLRENENAAGRADRFLELALFDQAPMAAVLSGLEVEYAIALLYSSEAGKREATIAFDIGQGTQDLGFRAETAVLFDIRAAIPVRLRVRDSDGAPTTARFLFSDRQGHVYPPQARRLAPDFFFQKQIYRADGETVLLPPGELTAAFGRGPEYRWRQRAILVPVSGELEIEAQLERWVDPAASGFYSGDHHIHGAGCAHYSSPTEGVFPADIFRQVKGEGLNVGCVLTWGPCFDFQKRFFSPDIDALSEPLTLLKYDIEVSGFGSQALGHLCLLGLEEQIYPGADGSRGWPTWTLPVLRWAKAQGAVSGHAHSGSGLQVRPAAAARRLLEKLDGDRGGRLERAEAAAGLMPEPFAAVDADGSGALSEDEIAGAFDRAADRLPNLAVPELDSVGAQEIFVSTALGLCDFISSMDTARLLEWNCWYHLLNCGFPLKVSGETDFPCMSGTRVGQGRVYVRLGAIERLSYEGWLAGLRAGRSYVSDGYAHALDFEVAGARPGETVRLDAPGRVRIDVRVAFSPETPLEVYYGGVEPAGGPRLIGDTVVLHESAGPGVFRDGKRLVEIVVNGRAAASTELPADGQAHRWTVEIEVARSGWVALRHFPQLHTNPVDVLVAGKPIRASRDSARWCLEAIDQLWRQRGSGIAAAEREAARAAYDEAREVYRRVIREAEGD